MGILDGIVKGLAEIVPDQGNPELKAYKAKNELKDLDAKENAIFARLGRQVYNDGGADAYPAVKAELDALSASRREVEGRIRSAGDEAEAQKAAQKAAQARRCPQCDAQNPESAAFCQTCGTRLAVARRFCPQCGAEATPDSRFCNECGTPLTPTP
jgi:ribosomal protein L40E